METRDCQPHRARRSRISVSRVNADSTFASPRVGIVQLALAVGTTVSSGCTSIVRRSSPANNPVRNIDRNVHGALSQSCIHAAYLAV